MSWKTALVQFMALAELTETTGYEGTTLSNEMLGYNETATFDKTINSKDSIAYIAVLIFSLLMILLWVCLYLRKPFRERAAAATIRYFQPAANFRMYRGA